ncbi:MAG: type VI secretion system baseplate subunit TssK [Proteobacteria bacterium]|nr:type VI secretion system baseplate subunit TssK [Pseudomonadota bacterium]
MITASKVVWSEGMFLHPHHFQQQDRYVESLIINYIKILQPYYWGISELKIDVQALAMGKFSITACQGILPDGTFFNIPHQDKTPPPIEISPQDTNAVIYLAVPVRQQGISEVALEGNKQNTALRYQAETVEMSDSNIGSDHITPIQVSALKFRLATSHQDVQGYEYLGITRISEVHASKKVVLDVDYLPTCLNVQAVPSLFEAVKEITGLIHYRGNVLMERLSVHESNQLLEANDYMLLQIMNRYEPYFSHLSNNKNLHPEQLYNLLIQLAGELATFTTKQHRAMPMPPYLHHDLNSVFIPLIKEVRKNLSIVIEENAVALKLEQQQPNTWTVVLNDKSLLNSSSFVISVYTAIPPDEIRTLFPAQAKASPVEHLQDLIVRALSGIDMVPLSTAPREIPYHANHSYFLLSKHHPLWQRLKNSAALAIHVSGEFPGLSLKLWAIKDPV